MITVTPLKLGRRAARRAGAVVKLAAWFALLAAAITLLRALGHGTLALPPLRHWAADRRWLSQTAPDTVVVAMIRVIALALAWYLLCTSILAVVVRLFRQRALLTICDAITLPSVRRLVGGAIGMTLLAVPLTMGTGMAGAAPAGPAVTGGPTTTSTTLLVGPGARATDPPIMRRLPDVGSAPRLDPKVSVPAGVTPSHDDGPTGPVSPARSRPEPATASPAASTIAGAAVPVRDDGRAVRTTWIVRPGDHLWHVAETVLSDAWGRTPTDPELVPYWHTLVEANRRHLTQRANPDLIFPGQILDVPAPPPPGAPT